MFSKLSTLITLFVIPAAIAGDSPHCVAATDSYNVTTVQCNDGSVTITSGGNKTAVVCSKGHDGTAPKCTEVKL